jgi:hypothetical protein
MKAVVSRSMLVVSIEDSDLGRLINSDQDVLGTFLQAKTESIYHSKKRQGEAARTRPGTMQKGTSDLTCSVPSSKV